MDIEFIQSICLKLPFVKEDIKWGNDLCFLIGEKMFCVVSLEGPLKVSLKVKPDQFDDLIEKVGITPAPYLARYKWILIENPSVLSIKEWTHYIRLSYDLVQAKLYKKKLSELKSNIDIT